METLAELFVHPAGYCQNVLATGRCWISGTDRVAGREASSSSATTRARSRRLSIGPTTTSRWPSTGWTASITRLVESVGGEVTRVAEAVHLEPDAALPATTFDFEFPEGTTLLY